MLLYRTDSLERRSAIVMFGLWLVCQQQGLTAVKSILKKRMVNSESAGWASD